MAEQQTDQRARFPVIPSSHWQSLRERFRKSLPGNVDARYIATALDMNEESARSNVLPALKTLDDR